jgi:ribose 5-phosphate isomerase B
MKIFLGADHAGFELKEIIKGRLQNSDYEVIDLGAPSYNKEDDYPDFVIPVARAVSQDPENNRGIVFGGSGQGEAMAANRFIGVRAAVFYGPPSGFLEKMGEGIIDPFAVVKLSREHNDANVLALGARFLSEEIAIKGVLTWLETPFSGEERHVRRLSKF